MNRITKMTLSVKRNYWSKDCPSFDVGYAVEINTDGLAKEQQAELRQKVLVGLETYVDSQISRRAAELSAKPASRVQNLPESTPFEDDHIPESILPHRKPEPVSAAHEQVFQKVKEVFPGSKRMDDYRDYPLSMGYFAQEGKVCREVSAPKLEDYLNRFGTAIPEEEKWAIEETIKGKRVAAAKFADKENGKPPYQRQTGARRVINPPVAQQAEADFEDMF